MLFDDLSDIPEENPQEEATPRPRPARDTAFDTLKFELQEEVQSGTRIKVIGVGGGGCNAAGSLYRDGLQGVEFCAVNTDRQALNASPIPHKVLIGQKVTNGLGAGADPSVGRESALEDTGRIIEILDGADMVFVAAGMGGGTGTGAAPVIASLAKELNALTVAIVTKPFAFEGNRRMKAAQKGVDDLAGTVDTLIQIPNEKLISLVPKGTPIKESFRVADDVLKQAVIGIADIMNTPGLINRDFSDIRAIMHGMGHAMMGTATASGECAAVEAAMKAIDCPMLDEEGMKGARAVLINITGSSRITLDQVNEACTLICDATANKDVQVNFGIVLDEGMGDKVKVTVIATGFQREVEEEPVEQQPTRVGFFKPPEPLPPREPEPMEMFEDVPDLPNEVLPDPEPAHEHVMAAAAAAASPTTNGSHQLEEPSKVLDDLDVPAYLRKERKWWS